MKITAILFLFALSMVCEGHQASASCASMRDWYPGIEPQPVTDKSPYKLVIKDASGYSREGLYDTESVHNGTYQNLFLIIWVFLVIRSSRQTPI